MGQVAEGMSLTSNLLHHVRGLNQPEISQIGITNEVAKGIHIKLRGQNHCVVALPFERPATGIVENPEQSFGQVELRRAFRSELQQDGHGEITKTVRVKP